LALSAEASWKAILAGESGIGRITQFDPSDLPCQIAGEVKGFSAKDFMNFKEARRMSRASQLAVAAGQMALDDAALSLPLSDPDAVGTVVGTGMGGIERAYENWDIYRKKGLSRVNPFSLTSVLPNMPSHHISLMAGSQGPISTVVAACATGTQAIGEGAELIRHGRAKVVLAGGVEGLIHEAAIAGFAAMRALSTAFNDRPEKASRPFDADRDGFILSEGAGIVVLERLDHALERGAKIYAEYLGYASSSDAFHVAAPDPEGAGAIRAMSWALEDAGVALDEVGYINAHGSSTPINDLIETQAIKQLFGEEAYNIPVSSTKSAMGHAMGGAGAIEAIFCIFALQQGMLPPTLNFETPDPECDLDYVPNVSRVADIRVAMSNSFGLGGQNACLVLSRYDSNGMPDNDQV
jgi:beta-ketoacyl-acyl-carrier-protein synthase II